jgi:hypothetical protein
MNKTKKKTAPNKRKVSPKQNKSKSSQPTSKPKPKKKKVWDVLDGSGSVKYTFAEEWQADRRAFENTVDGDEFTFKGRWVSQAFECDQFSYEE